MTDTRFSRDNLPAHGWVEYRKTQTTPMVRVDGPFTVDTREGPLHCEDGYLACPADGWPYPVAADYHDANYEPAAALPTPPAEASGAIDHQLKTWPPMWSEVASGTKTVEIRKDDRHFRAGDTLLLREYDPEFGLYTGRQCVRIVTHVLSGGQFGLEPGHVALSITRREATDG